MAAKGTPTKYYLRKFGDAGRLCSSDAGNILRYTANKYNFLRVTFLSVVLNKPKIRI